MPNHELRDVVIAGAGPVGLFLACELALVGLDVVIVEQANSPQTPIKSPPLGLRGLSVASAEALYRRGLLDELLVAATAPGAAGANCARSDAAKPAGVQVGHFGGIPIQPNLVDRSRWKYSVPSPASTNFAVDMSSVESVLERRARTLGVEIRRGQALTGLREKEGKVTIEVGNQTLHGRWLVGCDGGRSAVRKLAGFEFVGTEPESTVYYAVVDVADPQKLKPGRNSTASGFYMNLPGQISIADFDGGAFDRLEAITRERLQEVLRRVSEIDVTVTDVKLATSFTDRAKIATSYRRGRVLLAGDAAHVHSALGGQGLNAGLGDAMNLGWKLAATVRGTAPAGLLDTYETERHPVGRWLLDWTRAQAAIMKPTPQAEALRNIVRSLADTPDGATFFAEQLWGISLHYDLGGTHPLAGYSAPDLRFDDGTRLADHLRDGAALLLDLSEDEPLRGAAEPWRDRIRYAAVRTSDGRGLSALLIRPDGFVAWASDDRADQLDLEAAAARWFDAPSAVR